EQRLDRDADIGRRIDRRVDLADAAGAEERAEPVALDHGVGQPAARRIGAKQRERLAARSRHRNIINGWSTRAPLRSRFAPYAAQPGDLAWARRGLLLAVAPGMPRILVIAALCLIAVAPPADARPRQVAYVGGHPIAGGGWCEIEGPHVHLYLPEHATELYRVTGGRYYFIGDPVPF